MGELEDFIYKYFIIVDQVHGSEVNGELRQRIAAVATAALAPRQAYEKSELAYTIIAEHFGWNGKTLGRRECI